MTLVPTTQQLDSPGGIEALANAVLRFGNDIGWTDLRIAKTGDGEDPPTVVVPKTDREFGQQSKIWVHTETGHEVEKIQAYPDNVIPLSNSVANIGVWIGKPPRQSEYHVLIQTSAGQTKTGGSAMFAAIQQAAYLTTDRVVNLGIYHVSGLVLGLRAGYCRIGNTDVRVTSDNNSFLDVTPYVPTTASKDKWIKVGINTEKGAAVIEGAEFDTSDPNPLDYFPVTKADGVYYLADLRLTYGMTDLASAGVLLSAPDIFAVGLGSGAASEGGSSTTDPEYQTVDVYNDTGSAANVDLITSSAATSEIWLRKQGVGGAAVVQTNTLGSIRWYGNGSDGVDDEGASISAVVTSTPSEGDMPTTLYIRTAADGSANPSARIEISHQGVVTVNEILDFGDAQTVAIATGVVTMTHSVIILQAETGTADDLDTLTIATTATNPVAILRADAGDTITVKHGTGNIELDDATDRAISGNKQLMLVYNAAASVWTNIAW